MWRQKSAGGGFLLFFSERCKGSIVAGGVFFLGFFLQRYKGRIYSAGGGFLLLFSERCKGSIVAGGGFLFLFSCRGTKGQYIVLVGFCFCVFFFLLQRCEGSKVLKCWLCFSHAFYLQRCNGRIVLVGFSFFSAEMQWECWWGFPFFCRDAMGLLVGFSFFLQRCNGSAGGVFPFAFFCRAAKGE